MRHVRTWQAMALLMMVFSLAVVASADDEAKPKADAKKAEKAKSTATPTTATNVLDCIPVNAAFVLHIDAAAMMKSPIGQTFREGNPGGGYAFVTRYLGDFGIKIEDVQTMTLVNPNLKNGQDQAATGFWVTLNRPYDRATVIAAAKKMRPEFEKLPEVAPGLFEEEVGGIGTVRYDLTDPKRLLVYGPGFGKNFIAQDPKTTGPTSDAIAAARRGEHFVMAMNLDNFPPEIRNDLPGEFDPYKPLFNAETIVVTLHAEADLELLIKVKAPTRPKAIEAEKSMGVLKSLLQTLLLGLKQQYQASKDETQKPVVVFLEGIEQGLRSGKFKTEENVATYTTKFSAKLDYAPLVNALLATPSRTRGTAVSQNNLKQLGLGIYNYESSFSHYPPAVMLGKKGKALHSWRVLILPFIEQDELYKKFKLDEPWDSEHNTKVFNDNPMPATFRLPGSMPADSKVTHYQVFRGNGAMFDKLRVYKVGDIVDGTSNTIMIATAKTPVQWNKPDDLEFDPEADPRELVLFENDRCNVTMGDGSVRGISIKVDKATLRAVITKGGGEVAYLP